MELKVEKDLLPLLPDHINDLWTGMSEELFSDFEHSYAILETGHPMLGFPEVFHVESKDDLIFRIVRRRMNHSNTTLLSSKLII